MSGCLAVPTKNLLNWHSAPAAVVNCGCFDAKSIRPLLNTQRFSVELNKKSWRMIAAVICLLCSCCPAAVSGFIVPVVVDTVEREIKTWSLAHVFTEGLKGVQPTLADCDSAFSVSVKACGRLPQASVFHGLPRFVSWAIVTAVFQTPITSDIGSQASATSLPTPEAFVAKNCSCCQRCVSAITEAVPNDQVFAASASERDNCQSLKLLADQIQNSLTEFRQLETLAMINNSHNDVLGKKGFLWLEPIQCYSTARLASLYTRRVEVCNVTC